ncbi:hypothetical protein AMTRI_Chr13g83830 [Amborella trichopoda]
MTTSEKSGSVWSLLPWRVGFRMILGFWMVLFCVAIEEASAEEVKYRNAYASMMYMGTPRDYEFYVALRVMLRSLKQLEVEADLVVIASKDVPFRWIDDMRVEDGAKVVVVENVDNPYKYQANFNRRFMLTLNKLYAWSLIDYDRVVMLDSDNLFLQKTDELFQCGQFCAVFINPCIFHTGLFVLQPSMEVFKDMMHELENGRKNSDGADQGFLVSYFPDLLDRPMFHPPANGTKLNGYYRLPLGYQMDASYYYLKLRWSIPCGPNSVITFPSALWLKPWYWWSWPVLPLGLAWHEQRRHTLGYGTEVPVVLIQSAMYLLAMWVSRLARPTFSKLCYRRPDKNFSLLHTGLKTAAMWSVLASYIVPFFLAPRTIHPALGWSLYLLGSSSLLIVVANAFLLPALALLTPWLLVVGALGVMAFPYYPDGVVRALMVFVYGCFCAPFIWMSLLRVVASVQTSLDREALFPKLGESAQTPECTKLY